MREGGSLQRGNMPVASRTTMVIRSAVVMLWVVFKCACSLNGGETHQKQQDK